MERSWLRAASPFRTSHSPEAVPAGTDGGITLAGTLSGVAAGMTIVASELGMLSAAGHEITPVPDAAALSGGLTIGVSGARLLDFLESHARRAA